jgi:hypothetical protein
MKYLPLRKAGDIFTSLIPLPPIAGSLPAKLPDSGIFEDGHDFLRKAGSNDSRESGIVTR